MAVCQYQSFARAAEKTYITQPSISWHIKSLEQEFGCQLIDRGKGLRQIRLTRAGECFYQQAAQMLRIWQRTEQLLNASSNKMYRFACTPSMAELLFGRMNEHFESALPEYEPRWFCRTSAEIYEGIKRGDFDGGLVAETTPSPTLRSIPIASEPCDFVCRIDAPYGEEVSLYDLPISHMLYRHITKEFTAWCNYWIAGTGRPKIHIDTMTDFRQFMTAPEDWRVLPRSVFRRAGSEFRTCTLKQALPWRSFYFAVKYPLMQPCTDVAADALREFFSTEHGWVLLLKALPPEPDMADSLSSDIKP